MKPFDPNSTSKTRSELHFRYSINLKASLGIPSFYFFNFHSTFVIIAIPVNPKLKPNNTYSIAEYSFDILVRNTSHKPLITQFCLKNR